MTTSNLLLWPRWLAILVAAGFVVLAAIVAYHSPLMLSVGDATFTSFIAVIGIGLQSILWYFDRHDRLLKERKVEEESSRELSRRDAQRRSDLTPHLELIAAQIDAGGGYHRNLVYLTNHGPGVAADLEIVFETLSQRDLEPKPLIAAVWDDPPIVAKSHKFPPQRLKGLPVGSPSRVLLYEDNTANSRGGSSIPIGPADLQFATTACITVRANDIEGQALNPVVYCFRRGGGWYDGPVTSRGRWIEGWIPF